MRVLCAPDGFKESLSGSAAARAMAAGVRRARPNAAVDVCPVSDGGEGFVEAVTASGGFVAERARVVGPLRAEVTARWAFDPRAAAGTAVLEMAAASGLELVARQHRDPLRTTTHGTGQLVRAALDRGARRVLLGAGGSATIDCGCGAAQALGVRFFDASGARIEEPLTGGSLERIARIDTTGLDARLAGVELVVAVDVRSPLARCARWFGEQKGATPEMARYLDRQLARLAELFGSQLGVDVGRLRGAGAAGGLAAGLAACCGADLRPGSDVVLDATRFDDRVRGSDLCLTGEGRLDGQTAEGKAVAAVLARARRYDVPTIALVGSLGPGYERVSEAGLAACRVIGAGLTARESMRRTAVLLERAAAAVMSERAWA